MKIIYYLLGLTLIVGSAYITDESCCTTQQSSGEQLLNEKQFPNDFFYFQRSYPDKSMDVEAYKKVLKETALEIAENSTRDADVAWTLEGPKNIGGRINAVIAHPDDSDIMYVGNTTGGVFKTENGGADWYPVFDDQPFQAIGTLAFEPGDPETVYVGTGDPNISGYPAIGNGVYRSEDGGDTWTHLGLEDECIVSKIIIDPDDTQTIYASTMGLPFEKSSDRGLYKSTDGGQTWQQSLFISDSAGVIDMVMDPFDSQTLYAAGWNRIRNSFYSLVRGPASRVYKTTDGGATWTMLSGGLPMLDLSRPGLAISQLNPGVVYALYVDTDYNVHSIHKTEDGGTTWSEVNTSSLPDDVLGGFGWYFGQIRVSPVDDDELYVLGVSMYKTTNGGGFWFESTPWSQGVHADKHDMFFVDPSTLLLSTDGGLYKSDDTGSNWEDIEDIPNTQFYRVKVNHHQDGVYYGGTQDNGTIRGNSQAPNSWVRVFGADGFQPLFDVDDPFTYYVETQNGGLYYTTSGGSNWDSFTSGINFSDPRSWDMPFARNEENVYYTGTNRIYRHTTAPFGSWQAVSSVLTDGTNNRYHIVSAIGTSKKDADIVYAGTSDARVWRSLNAGSSWEEITGDLPNRYVTAVRSSPNITSGVVVTHSGYKMNDFIPHIHYSNDNGDTWMDISGDLPQFAINDATILWDHADSVIFVATDGGVYGTLNGGNNWFRMGNNMPIIPVYDIEVDPAYNRLIAGTHARSMMSFPIDSLILVTGTEERIARSSFAVYPNPSSDMISLDLDDTGLQGDFDMFIYDINGRLVKQDVVQNRSGIVISDLPEGRYILKVKAEAGVYTSQFVKTGS
jgi:photosystem II stability/assembly factor-like uncharacterized protein